MDKVRISALKIDYLEFAKDEEIREMRGKTRSVSVVHQNFIMLFGCRPGMGVKAET